MSSYSMGWLLIGFVINLFITLVNCEVYMNEWAVHIEGGINVANEVAEEHGFINLGQVGSLTDYYRFQHHKINKRSLDQSDHHHTRLTKHPKVKWAEQQKVRIRVKRDYKTESGWSPHFQDKLWPKQWYMHGGAHGKYDMNVLGAWEMGYTGKGVVVTILDDGIERTHTDLQQNYDPQASYDINGRDMDPMPRYDSTDENRHGTRCAGEVAAFANNSVCAVGVAYNAYIGGVRMLDGDVSDIVEAAALSHNPNHVDVYSASWGPDDNGRVVDGPARLAKEAFITGVLKGRNGKGSIFVWASGNGGSYLDSCACDGYTNSIFTLSVSSTSEHGNKPWYLEQCASTLTTTYSSGENYHERKIVTTDLHDKCTELHTGTSASAPLAAGIIALALEANGDLTWRDMQHLVIMTSRPDPIVDGEWVTNGVNRRVSHKYGYGLMDGTALVQLAERWTTVPDQNLCMSEIMELEEPIVDKGTYVKVVTDACEGTPNHVRYLEHVQAKITLRFSRRGDLQIHLVSPNGTRSTLLPRRKNDYANLGFDEWPFMSVFYWGENPVGTWKLEVENMGDQHQYGVITQWQLILYGTETQPVNLKDAPDRRVKPAGGQAGSGDSIEVVIIDGNKPQDTENEVREKADIDTDVIDKIPSSPKQCHDECEEDEGCVGPQAEDCVSCKHVRMGAEGACLPVCPERTFEDPLTSNCQHCPNGCTSCKKGGICFTCADGFFHVQDLHQCVQICPDGYYADMTSSSCQKCAESCAVCGSSADHCSQCAVGYELYKGAICVPQCTENQFRNEDGSCGDCDVTCRTCQGPLPTQCLTCQSGLIYLNASCLHKCPKSFYKADTDTDKECKRCHPSCERCTGGTFDECVSCQPPLKLAGSVCEETCPPGQYDTETSCRGCHSMCLTCRGPSDTDCLSCKEPRLLLNGKCVDTCPHSFYPDTSSLRVCSSCHRTCHTCNGPGAQQCIECGAQLLRATYDDICVPACQEREFAMDGKCKHCPAMCESCTDEKTCTQCLEGSLLYHHHCVGSCPEGMYAHLQARECRVCHFSCHTCTGEGAMACLRCKDGYVLSETSGMCMEKDDSFSCPTGEFYQSAKGLCLPCHSSCASCSGLGPQGCESCHAPLQLYHDRKQCVRCCSRRVTQQCCVCDQKGHCRQNHFIISGYQAATISPYDASLDDNGVEVTYPSVVASSAPPSRDPWTAIIALAGIFTGCAVLMVVLVMFLMQARQNERLCWRVRYKPVPTFYQNGHDKHGVPSAKVPQETSKIV